MKVLVIEDDTETADYIADSLKKRGHLVDHCVSGQQGLLLASTKSYDAIVADRMLPGMDGINIVKSIRKAGVNTPVLFLTAMDGIDDRVTGFEVGGDDYLVKPFALPELLARLNALTRRLPFVRVDTTLEFSDLKLDLIHHRVTRAGVHIPVQPREFALLEYFMRNANRIVTRRMLLENVWNYHFDPKTKIVETHISRLRGKVDSDPSKQLIHTVRGSGYILRESE